MDSDGDSVAVGDILASQDSIVVGGSSQGSIAVGGASQDSVAVGVPPRPYLT